MPESYKIRHIGNLDLSTRTQRLLVRAGIIYIDHLQSISDEALRQIPGLGVKRIAEIRAKLKDHVEREKAHHATETTTYLA